MSLKCNMGSFRIRKSNKDRGCKSVTALRSIEDKMKNVSNLIRMKRKLESEVNNDVKEMNKALKFDSYMTERMNEVFNKPYKKILLEGLTSSNYIPSYTEKLKVMIITN